MLRTATVTELRAELSSYLEGLKEGPLLVRRRGQPRAIFLELEMYEVLVEKLELLLEVFEARVAIDECSQDARVAVDAEEIFERLGH